MNDNKIIKSIKFLENQSVQLKSELVWQSILSYKNFEYSEKEKKDFLWLWKKYITFFNKTKKLILRTKHKRLYVFINLNKYVLKRHLIIFYYNSLIEFIEILWLHESYIRQLLEDNFRQDISYFSKFVYNSTNIQIVNIHPIFISFIVSSLDTNVKKFIKDKIIETKSSSKRIQIDSNNIYFIVKKNIYQKLFKISKILWTKIAETRFSKRINGLIKKENIEKYLQEARPGDILLTRWNWNATNISIPWFWKHMSLYLWTWEYLINTFPELCKKEDFEKNHHYIIESTWKWVQTREIFNLISHNDYLWVVRTKFQQEKIQRSLGKALLMRGVWYDFLFNFYSDKNVVCSELVLKSYAKEFKEDVWIPIQLEQISFWLTFPPHNLIKVLKDEEKKENPSLAPFFFIDSREKTQENFISTNEEFLKTLSRPKYSFFLK